ncbi:MAG TPA: 4-hydroxy-tetrahydrodipicolinate reductase, partial [Burkholderiales bacterium]|nr:4-hydroxy-tetrahydrodipicolinate reductase [Burkholderiales bacterium]
MSLNVAIAGASGRMGRTLIEAVLRDADLKLTAALEIAGNAHLGKDAGELIGASCGVKITDDVECALKGCDAIIDFTRPEGTLHYVALCRTL